MRLPEMHNVRDILLLVPPRHSTSPFNFLAKIDFVFLGSRNLCPMITAMTLDEMDHHVLYSNAK